MGIPEEMRNALIVAIVGAVLAAFVLAAGAVTLDACWKPWKRWVPMGALLSPALGYALAAGALRPWVEGCIMACALLCPIFLLWTFCLAWNGERLADRALRVSSAILFFLFFSLASPSVT